MPVIDFFYLIPDLLILSSRMQKLRDKFRAILLFLIPISHLVSIRIPRLERVMLVSMKDLTSKIDCRNKIREVKGIKYVLNDCISFFVVSPAFERWMWKYLKPRKGETFLDVGAHIGKYALYVAKIVGEKGKVIAVEPDPENFKALMDSIRFNGLRNVRAFNVAAWNKVGKLKFYRSISSGTVKRDRGLGYIEVEAIPLDNVLRGEKVDWIKIDVERAELETLEGLRKTIEKHRPTVLAEVGKCNAEKVISFMRKRGYTAKIIHRGSAGYQIFLSAMT